MPEEIAMAWGPKLIVLCSRLLCCPRCKVMHAIFVCTPEGVFICAACDNEGDTPNIKGDAWQETG